MIETIIFIVTFMSAWTHIFALISLGIFGRNLDFPHIYNVNLSTAFISYPSIGYQIYWWFNFVGVELS